MERYEKLKLVRNDDKFADTDKKEEPEELKAIKESLIKKIYKSKNQVDIRLCSLLVKRKKDKNEEMPLSKVIVTNET